MRSVLKCLPLGAILLASCRAPFDPANYNSDWTKATHGQSPANYAVVFPQDSVNRMDIILNASKWAGIRANMTHLWGFDFGAGDHPCCGPYPSEDPDFVDAELRFNGKTWKHVGFRLKGAASLNYSWNAGNYKLPFRLKFDEFEDTYPETWNQRFYGFRETTMAPNAFDPSLLREKVANEVFRLAGVPSPRTAYYRVYIDLGQGLVYNGVYTMVEAVEDQMLLDQFGEERGTLYKPFATLLGWTRESDFPQQNNRTTTDFSDIRALIRALNDTDLRSGNPAQWRANLETVFDVDLFLKYLAVNNTIVSWDAYGIVPHNYYLYHHSSGQLRWIPWDQNNSFYLDPDAGVDLALTEVDDTDGPLIRYLADDPVYWARYRAQLQAFYQGVFTQGRLDGLFEKYHGMVAPHVIGLNGEQPGHTHTSSGAFINALPTLKGFVANRRLELEDFLRGPTAPAPETRW